MICAVARFQVACSARFNDLQHTALFEVTEQGKTLELRAWQTKTVSAFRIKKHPVPLIAPLYSFTGVDWWSPLLRAWKRFAEEEAFKTMDYIIPTVSKDYVGLIPRPCQADRALRWLKEALHRQGGLDPREFRDLSWHSFRVFIPDCAFPLGMPRDQRQYLGNWSSENAADIYTREKRKVVERAWTAVADQLDRLDLSTRPDKPVDLKTQTGWTSYVWRRTMAPPWNPRPSGPRQTALPLRQVRTGPSSAWLVPMCWWIFYPTRNQRLPGASGRAHTEKKGQPFPLTLTGSTWTLHWDHCAW